MNAICHQCHAEAPLFLKARDKNLRVSSEVFDYYRCQSCGLVFLHPIPPDLGRFYPPSYYLVSYSLESLAEGAGADAYKIELVQKHVPSGRLLEIGPGGGAFAYLAQQAGYDVTVIEMDQACCDFLGDKVGVKAINSADPVGAMANEGSFDVVALWHVIEHVPDPWSVLEAAAACLRPGGILIMATPNPASSQFWVFRRHWVHLDPPRHLSLISTEIVKERAEKSGLELVSVTTTDPGGLRWNTFGWQMSLCNMFASRNAKRVMYRLGRILSFLARPIERGDHRGATYTLTFRKSER